MGSLALGVVLALRGGRMPTRHEWPGLVAIGLLWFGLYNVALNAGDVIVVVFANQLDCCIEFALAATGDENVCAL